MVKLTASEIIRRKFKGQRNFMTPTKLKVGKLNPNVAYELSTGSGLGHGNRLYGVTVVSAGKSGKTNSQHNLSKAFGNKNEAEAYINGLKEKLKARRKK